MANKIALYDMIKESMENANDMYNYAIAEGKEENQYFKGMIDAYSMMLTRLTSWLGDTIDAATLMSMIPSIEIKNNYLEGYHDALETIGLYYELSKED